jgi:two-component system, chemotaxis family, protein-glutamate methylesterase/glutaminase
MIAQDDTVEEALWVALQTLQERAQMLESMARDDRGRGRDRSASSMQERASEARAHADRLREFVARIGVGSLHA